MRPVHNLRRLIPHGMQRPHPHSAAPIRSPTGDHQNADDAHDHGDGTDHDDDDDMP